MMSNNAFHRVPFWLRPVDKWLLLGVLLLLTYGIIILISASSNHVGIVKKQLIHVGLGLTVMIFMANLSPMQLKRFGPWIYIIGLAMLSFVLVLGEISKGAQRWLDFGLFRFQPSEIMKIATPIVLATMLDTKSLPINGRDLIFGIVLIALPVACIVLQPDLGTGLLILASGVSVLFFAGLSWKLISMATLLGIVTTPFLWLGLHDYQKKRILTFLYPEEDPLGSGYHIIQSKIALGSGGFFGKGWGLGTQTQLDFLPEQSTDFIFSVLGEEFGFVGVIILLLFYLFVLSRGTYIAIQAKDTFSRLFAGGLVTTLFVYIVVNIGMVSGVLPVVGLPLPLISYGGTSMITVMATLGMLMSISAHRPLLSK